ncbi:MAG: ChaN family lipoprotein [Candidatus Aminicenantales bacterium]
MTPIRRLIPLSAVVFGILGGALVAAARPQTAMPAAQAPAGAPADKPDLTLTLKIGDPALKDKVMEIGPGDVLSSRTGRPVAFERMIDEMMAARIVHVGETHNSMPMHEIEYQVIRALYARDKHLAIGLEMVPVTLQEALNKWTEGILTKEEFLREVRWYVTWNFNFGFYEKIFDFAREHRLPIYALNAPREVITKIRMRGWDALTDEEKSYFPGQPDTTNQDHRTLIRTVFESADMPHAMMGPGLDQVFEGLYRSQSAWDEVMGANAVRAVQAEGRRVVVCVGSGHLLYNLGLNRRAYEMSKLPFKTVIAVEVPAAKKTLPVSRAIGDYVFGLAEQAKPAFPTIGLGLKKVENLENLVVDAKPTEGAASRADFDKGDVILSADGKAYSDINELRLELANLRCGGEVKFKVLRAGQVKDVALKCEKAAAAEPAEKKGPETIMGPSVLEGQTPREEGQSHLAGMRQLKTPAEEAGDVRYSQNESIASFLSALDLASKEVAVSIVGRTLPTDAYGARDIFLVVISRNGAATPETLDRSKPTVLFTAAQHGNEQSAKEAVLQIIRDVAVGDLRPLLDKVNVLAIPQTNPYGNCMNVRVNELDLDMNRDHVKTEAEGVRAIHRVFRDFMPEATIDVHEKGDDYYRVSIGCVSNVNIGRDLQDFSRGVLLAEVEKSLAKRRIAFHEYLVTEDLGVDTSSGAAYERGPSGPREEMKRYSTTDLNDGRNSLGIFETLSFIQEGASRHDLETLNARTAWQYQGLRAFLESVAAHAPEVLKMVRGDRARLLERAAARAATDPVHLRMIFARDPKEPQLALKKFETVESPIRGVLKVDKKAGETLLAGDIAPAPGPRTMKIVEEVVKNWFPNVEPTLSVARPRGYFVPGGRLDIVETLLALGVEVGLVTKDGLVDAEAYEVTAVVPSKLDYVAPDKIDVVAKPAKVPVRKGDFYVDCVQPAANLVPSLLEPQSEFGLIRYWKFELVPEAGGVFEILRFAGTAAPAVIPYKPWRS